MGRMLVIGVVGVMMSWVSQVSLGVIGVIGGMGVNHVSWASCFMGYTRVLHVSRLFRARFALYLKGELG